MVLSLPNAPTSRVCGKSGGFRNAGMQAIKEDGDLPAPCRAMLMFWHIYEDAARFREWLSHRRTRAMRARLNALAECYAERTSAPVVLITDEPEGYDVKLYRCDKDTALVRLYLCWQGLLQEHRQREAAKIRAAYMN